MFQFAFCEDLPNGAAGTTVCLNNGPRSCFILFGEICIPPPALKLKIMNLKHTATEKRAGFLGRRVSNPAGHKFRRTKRSLSSASCSHASHRQGWPRLIRYVNCCVLNVILQRMLIRPERPGMQIRHCPAANVKDK